MAVGPGTGERAFIEDGAVGLAGPLGVDAKNGWYVPAHAIEDDPELVGWEGFDYPAVVAAFATPETGERGRFLGTDPAYAQFDEELIGALDLPFQVVYSGSDAATTSEVARKVEAGEPVLHRSLRAFTPSSEDQHAMIHDVEYEDRTVEAVAARWIDRNREAWEAWLVPG